MAIFAGIRNGFVIVVLATAALLSACGGEDTTRTGTAAPGASSSATDSATSQILSLSGTPVTAIKVGDSYSFTPVITGASTVGFAIANKPAWASFNTATGALSGSPVAAHIGTYANIVISATSGSGASATLAAFSLTVSQATSTGIATLSWAAPTQNTDGSSVSDLAGYRIYYGSNADSLTNSINLTNPSLTAYTVANLSGGTTYFGITAYTSGGVESGISNIGSKTIM